jgi:hypothetical protein
MKLSKYTASPIAAIVSFVLFLAISRRCVATEAFSEKSTTLIPNRFFPYLRRGTML